MVDEPEKCLGVRKRAQDARFDFASAGTIIAIATALIIVGVIIVSLPSFFTLPGEKTIWIFVGIIMVIAAVFLLVLSSSLYCKD